VLICVGAYLFTRMDESTSLVQAGGFMIVAGIGLGLYFAILTLAVQNAIPRTRMGVGTSAVRYMQQAGNTLGVAIIGTVVNNAIAGDITSRLPAGAQRLTPAGLAAATNPQILVNSTYHDTVIATAKQYAARAAVAQAQAAGKIPSGPAHDSVVAAITQQAQAQTVQLLDQIFAALKHSMAVGIQHGFVAAFIIGLITLVVACFLKDVPLSKSFREEPARPGVTGQQPQPDAASVG
jgi:hypothetical protein